MQSPFVTQFKRSPNSYYFSPVSITRSSRLTSRFRTDISAHYFVKWPSMVKSLPPSSAAIGELAVALIPGPE